MPKVFSLDVSKINIEDVNDGDFLKLKMYVISDTPNRNNSEFLRTSFEKSIPTMYNKPILAYFNTKTGDTEEHNSQFDVDEFGDVFYDYDYDGAEKPVGVIPESANIYVEHVDGKNWVVIDSAYVWTEYNKRLTDLIKKQIRKKVSVEIESLDSKINDNGVEEIGQWRFLGVTILGRTPDGELIEEGIEGAKLVLKDYASSNEFNSYKNKFSFALKDDKSNILSKYGMIEKTNVSVKKDFISKEDYGTGETITVNKSKESVSEDQWGNVDKTTLRNTVLKAKNYKTIVKSVYLKVESGWEDSPSEKLKYPVMQYKDGKFVYNAGGLLSAQQYGEKYDEAVAKKALSLRKKLGLVKSEKEEKMKKFIEDAKTSGFTFLGLFNGKLVFAKEEMADSEDGMTEKTEMSVFEVDKEEAEKFACEDCVEEFAWDELTGKQVKMAEDKDDEGDDEKKELAAKCAALEAEKCELAARCETAEGELEKIRMAKFEEDTDAILSDEDEDIDEKTHEDMVKMRDEGKFANIEEFVKELAFKKYTLEKEKAKEIKKNKLDFNINTKKTPKSDKVIDALDNI